MKSIYLSCFLWLLLATVFGCRKPQEPNQPKTNSSVESPGSPAQIDKSSAGSIDGNVAFSGAPPKFPSVDMTQDPGCPTDPQKPEVVTVTQGKLANVFVYIKDGLGQAIFSPPSEPAVLDQKACRYVPHVLGLLVGQPLKVLNSDTAGHNVHPMPAAGDDEWNESQMPSGKPLIKTFHHPQLMIPVQCNQHPWMKAYLNVMTHPFFAVSGHDGKFTIKDLPAGEYTLAAVHEKFGEQDIRIKVEPRGTAAAQFVFGQ